MSESITIDIDLSPFEAALGRLAADAPALLLAAAARGARKACIDHFRKLEGEPAETQGFPRFGASWPGRHFWAGVARAVGSPDIQDGTATVSVDSAAWAHKAAENPPPILPKGGKRFLAIPANERSAAWDAMPKDFLGGDMRFGYARTPDGKMMPALLAARDHLRTIRKGKNAGKRVYTGDESRQESGHGDVQYWLVRKARTKSDPRARPPEEALRDAAESAAGDAAAALVVRSMKKG